MASDDLRAALADYDAAKVERTAAQMNWDDRLYDDVQERRKAVVREARAFQGYEAARDAVIDAARAAVSAGGEAPRAISAAEPREGDRVSFPVTGIVRRVHRDYDDGPSVSIRDTNYGRGFVVPIDDVTVLAAAAAGGAPRALANGECSDHPGEPAGECWGCAARAYRSAADGGAPEPAPRRSTETPDQAERDRLPLGTLTCLNDEIDEQRQTIADLRRTVGDRNSELHAKADEIADLRRRLDTESGTVQALIHQAHVRQVEHDQSTADHIAEVLVLRAEIAALRRQVCPECGSDRRRVVHQGTLVICPDCGYYLGAVAEEGHDA